MPLSVEIITSFLLINFGSYCNHHLLYKVPILWRLHRVHHSDPTLNTTSSLRFHPFDVVYSQGIYFYVAIFIFGISITSFILYSTIGLTFEIIQHGNIKFPDILENTGDTSFQHRAGIKFITQTHKSILTVITEMYSHFGTEYLAHGIM